MCPNYCSVLLSTYETVLYKLTSYWPIGPFGSVLPIQTGNGSPGSQAIAFRIIFHLRTLSWRFWGPSLVSSICKAHALLLSYSLSPM